jgi:DNA replication and repair protein RecF
MGLTSLEITGFRCFEKAELSPAPGVNLISGKNASGKTSLLEAIFLLGRGRSFRAARKEAMIHEGSDCLRSVGRLADGRVLGIEVSRGSWTARAGGQAIDQLSDLAGLLPVQVMDPEVHRLVQEGPGERRRYLDWATFHVKPEFLGAWRQYQRSLRQRNAALKSRQPDAVIQVWERSLAEHGGILDRLRLETVVELAGPVNAAAQRLLGADLHIEYRPGQAGDSDLAEVLATHRDRDRRAGMTQAGPHRADLSVRLDDHRARGWVSRGQQKLVAAAMVLGQARLLTPIWGGRAVLLVDDPAAELDRERCERLLALIMEFPLQVFLTTLDPAALPGLAAQKRFHVEQGRVTPVV